MALSGSTVNYASTIHLGAPTRRCEKRLQHQAWTWNWGNHIEHGWGNFTPFIDGGVGNTVPDTKYFQRLFTTFGYNAQFEGRNGNGCRAFSVSVSAYDIAPWAHKRRSAACFGAAQA